MSGRVDRWTTAHRGSVQKNSPASLPGCSVLLSESASGSSVLVLCPPLDAGQFVNIGERAVLFPLPQKPRFLPPLHLTIVQGFAEGVGLGFGCEDVHGLLGVAVHDVLIIVF